MNTSGWIPITLLDQRFSANLKSLQARYPALADQLRNFKPAQNYFISPAPDLILLGTKSRDSIHPLPHPVPPATAKSLAQQLYPNAKCGMSLVVAGEDLGWLLNTAYHLPCEVALAPGHRPPLFFLMRDFERLWVILHLQEWSALLADERVRLFVGPNVMEQFRQSLVDDVVCPWPKMSVTVDAEIWPSTLLLDAVLADVRVKRAARATAITNQLASAYSATTAESLAARFRSDQPLRVLGITSQYTSFLQYSTRDWLASFERLGHQTKLLIETADHQITNSQHVVETYEAFKPDLVLVIDHCRREYSGLPAQVPFVMWVQDRMPNIYCSAGGEMQERFDYVVGYGKQECVARYGYPASRFLPSMIGSDETRFNPHRLSAAEVRQFTCDVSFVSHASLPAEVILQSEIERLNTPDATRLLVGVFDRLTAVYDQGGTITEPAAIQQHIEQAMVDTGTTLPEEQVPMLADFFTQRVNNALFRHQTLQWLSQMDLNLHLYGKGWENHPHLKQFARGVADNQTQLSAIYQATAINLQVTPYGSAHQRLFDGLAAGGFFLLRTVPGDRVDRLQKQLWEWCQKHRVTSGTDLAKRANATVRLLLSEIAQLRFVDPFADIEFFYAGLEEAASGDFTRAASTLWKEYDQVSFSTQAELQRLVKHFLAAPEERRQIADSMRQRVMECHTYTAISRKLLRFITNDLERDVMPLRACA